MKSVFITVFITFFTLAVVPSCNNNGPSEPSVTQSVATLPSVYAIGNAQYHSILDSLHGDIIVVNIYAVWCAPCTSEIPSLIRLQHTYDSLGVKLIMLSMDDTAKTNTTLPPILYSRGIDFDTYILKPGDWGDLHVSIDPDWNGMIPFTVIFGRDGKRAYAWTGAESYEKFESSVLSLL